MYWPANKYRDASGALKLMADAERPPGSVVLANAPAVPKLERRLTSAGPFTHAHWPFALSNAHQSDR